MRISVIIPTLDEEQTIAAAIRSAWAAGVTEVIVVDGGSKDATSEIVQQEGGQLLTSPSGRAKQQNCGAEQSVGDVLLFLHADCQLPLSAQREIIETLQAKEVIYGGFRQKIPVDGTLYRWLESGNAWRIQRMGLVYGDQALFVRRKTFFTAGMFAEVAIMEDLLLSRVLRKLAPPALLQGPLIVSARRWQKRGVIGQTARNWMLLTAERIGISPCRLATYYPIVREETVHEESKDVPTSKSSVQETPSEPIPREQTLNNIELPPVSKTGNTR